MKPMALLVLALALFGGCASAGETDGATSPRAGITVEVRNNLIPPTGLRIWLVPRTGVRSLLGSVPGRETRVLVGRVVDATGEFRLLAESGEDQQIRSRPFTVVDESGPIEWDLTANVVIVR